MLSYQCVVTQWLETVLLSGRVNFTTSFLMLSLEGLEHVEDTL